jgi:hypothetical protein
MVITLMLKIDSFLVASILQFVLAVVDAILKHLNFQPFLSIIEKYNYVHCFSTSSFAIDPILRSSNTSITVSKFEPSKADNHNFLQIIFLLLDCFVIFGSFPSK